MNESYHVYAAGFNEINPQTIDSWLDLERRSLEANAYLSPHFILPALKHMDTTVTPLFILVEKIDGGSKKLVGLGVFTMQRPDLHFPLPYLRAYCSRHTYLTGLLIDRDHAEKTIQSFVDFVNREESKWCGILFNNRGGDGPFCELLEAIARQGNVFWNEYSQTCRAILIPSKCDEEYIARQSSGARTRRKKKLSMQGRVTWNMLSGKEVPDEAIERFLGLEDSGWKGEEGTSLRSKVSHEQFFREMIANFRADGNVFFTELHVGDVAVASTSHLISGGIGFAFKGGWHSDYAKWSPGILNELELIRNASEMCKGLAFVDSGAVEGSFIDQLWEDRRLLKTGMFLTSPIARFIASPINRMRQIKRNLGAIFRKAKLPPR